MIALYFRRGASILKMHAQPQVSVFEKVDKRGIYWNAPLLRQPHTSASAEKSDARLACFMLQLGSLLLLWREAGLPPVDQAINEVATTLENRH
jgi:hypothetical protein